MAGGMLHHLGLACREARLSAGLRQIEIATRAGTTHATISRFESGNYWPKNPDVWVEAYATEIGMDPLDLWTAAVHRWASEI